MLMVGNSTQNQTKAWSDLDGCENRWIERAARELNSLCRFHISLVLVDLMFDLEQAWMQGWTRQIAPVSSVEYRPLRRACWIAVCAINRPRPAGFCRTPIAPVVDCCWAIALSIGPAIVTDISQGGRLHHYSIVCTWSEMVTIKRQNTQRMHRK